MSPSMPAQPRQREGAQLLGAGAAAGVPGIGGGRSEVRLVGLLGLAGSLPAA